MAPSRIYRQLFFPQPPLFKNGRVNLRPAGDRGLFQLLEITDWPDWRHDYFMSIFQGLLVK